MMDKDIPDEIEDTEDAVEDEGKSLRDAIEDAAGGEQDAAPVEVEEVEEVEEIAPPEHWSQLDKDAFNDLPPDVRKLYLDKATSLEKGYNEKFEQIADWQKEKAALDEVFAPLASELSLHGMDRADVLRRLVGAHTYLSRDPEGALRWLAQQYGADYLLAGDEPDPFDTPDPRVQTLTQEIAQLKQQLQGFQGQYQTTQEAALSQQIQAFQTATDEQGKPKYPYFTDVRTQMGQLIQAGAAQSLEQAYEMAVWSNPDVRGRLMQADQQKANQAAEAKRRQEAEKARKASAARTAGSGRAGSGKAGSIREAVEQAVRGA
jgi:hypothetical protein